MTLIVFFSLVFSSCSYPLWGQSIPDYNWLYKIDLPTVLGSSLNTDDLTIAIAQDRSGNIFTLSLGSGIDKRDPEGNLLQKEFISAANLDSPRDLVVDDQGFIYVADYLAGGDTFRDDGKIKVFDTSGKYLSERTIFTSFYRPLGLAILDEHIYVAEYYDGLQGTEQGRTLSRVRVYNKATAAILRETEQVEIPLRIAVNSTGTIYVSQAGGGNPAVLILDSNLKPLGELSNIVSPGSLVVDALDYIHVIEYGNKIKFSDFINFDNLSIFETSNLAKDISDGVKNEEFLLKIYNPDETFLGSHASQLDFPVDLSQEGCGNLFVNNAEIFDGFIFGMYMPSKLEFDLEVYERIPSIDAIKPPVIRCPANIEKNVSLATSFATVTFADPEAIDNCSVTLIQTGGLPSGSKFPIGINIVEFTAVDPAGNAVTCSFTVLVTGEESSLEFSECPADLQVSADDGKCSAVVEFNLPVAFEDLVEVEVKQIEGISSGGLFPIGETIQVFEAVGAQGKKMTCSYSIFVSDATAPIADCPQNLEYAVEFGVLGRIVKYELPTFKDACSGIVIAQMSGLASGAQFPVGHTQNTFVSTDAAGNSTTCSFTVTIREMEDMDAPKIQCPSSFSISADPSTCNALAFYVLPEANDNSGEVLRTLVAGPQVGETIGRGSTIVRYVASDAAGNTATCEFTITVVDDTAPNIENCPGDQPEILRSGGFILPDYTANLTVKDCSEKVKFFQLPIAGTFVSESTRISLFAEDDANNLSTECSFMVMLTSAEFIEITSCPGTQVLQLQADCQAVLPDFTTQISTSISGDVVQEPAPGTPISDRITVRFTATDSNGYSDSCELIVNVEDLQKPEIDCVGDVTAIWKSEEGYVLPDFSKIISVLENCGEYSTMQDPSPGTTLMAEQEILLKVNDASGNVAECRFWLNLTEENNLTISCPTQQGRTFDENCGYVVEDFSSMVAVNFANAILKQEPAPGTRIFENAQIEVTATLEGEILSCSFDLILQDSQTPQAVCVGTLNLQLNDQGFATITPEQIDNGSSDNCEILSKTLSKTTFFTADVGKQWVTFTVVDAAGIESSCKSLVVIEAPQESGIICVESLKLELEENKSVILNPKDLFSGGTGSIEFVVSKEEFSCADIGEQKITFSFVTPAKEGSCEIKVVVTDPERHCQNLIDEPEDIGPFVILSPNPGDGLVEVFTSPDIVVQRVNVFDMRGRFLMSLNFSEVTPSKNYFILDLRKYQSGVYTIQLDTNTEDFIRRAIIKNQ